MVIFYNIFWPNLWVKISWYRNNINGKLYWIWCLYFTITYFIYIYLLLTLTEIFPPQPSSIYFIVIFNINRWNVWLKIVVEDKSMFTVYSVQFVLITKHMSITQYLGTTERLLVERRNIRENEIFLWTQWNAISSSYSSDQITC